MRDKDIISFFSIYVWNIFQASFGDNADSCVFFTSLLKKKPQMTEAQWNDV